MAFTSAHAQGWGRYEGRILDGSSGSPLPGATLVVRGTNFGTIADRNGRFSMRLTSGTHQLQASFVGYQTLLIQVSVTDGQVVQAELRLTPQSNAAGEVLVEGTSAEAGVQTLTPEQVQNIPGPFKDGFRALKNLPGVMSNNETSNEYSVRGGGYNENLIYINGFEVYKPFRTRQGEQEGLGLLNPDMSERMTLYTGGFPARFGGKLSSALDVQYQNPHQQPFTGSAYLSALDAGATARGGVGKWGISTGYRKAQARTFFGAQELKGNYDPNYTDAQTLVSYAFNPNHSLEGIGMWARHRFRFEPSQRRTYYGTLNDLRSVWINYNGLETDGYDIGMGGLRFKDRLSETWSMEHQFSVYDIVESEKYNVRADATLYLVDPNATDPDSPINDLAFGSVVQEDRADNRLQVQTWTGEGRYTVKRNRHIGEAGWSLRRIRWNDRLSEQSAVQGQNKDGDLVRVVVKDWSDTLPTTFATQAGGYIQDVVDWLPQPGRFVTTLGLRTDYFDFNQEWTVSPRFSASYRVNADLSLTAAWGIYYQPPTYRELRGETAQAESLEGALNRNLKSQRSVQYVMGGTYFLPRRRLYLRAEAYYKQLDRLISYTLQNTRITYSGENDSYGYVYGLDLQLRGEFVPGLESWINYGYMIAREKFRTPYLNKYNQGWIPRAMDQRHTISLFVQDAVSNDESWRVFLQVMLGSGLPYTPPTPGQSINNISLQTPGYRHSERFIEYKRADLGVTKSVEITKRGLYAEAKPPKLFLSLELLNIFDIRNTISYTWVDPGTHIWERIPTRLTPRTINARVRIQF